MSDTAKEFTLPEQTELADADLDHVTGGASGVSPGQGILTSLSAGGQADANAMFGVLEVSRSANGGLRNAVGVLTAAAAQSR